MDEWREVKIFDIVDVHENMDKIAEIYNSWEITEWD